MDAIAIADANKIRAAMGLPPLPLPGDSSAGLQFKDSNGDADSDPEDQLSTLEKRSAAASSNWAKLEAEKQEKLERQRRKEAAKKAREKAALNLKLQGKGLADMDGGDLDTKSWLKGQKKRQKKIEKQRQRDKDREAAEKSKQAQYTSKDLAGIKVGHAVDGFDAEEQILTLKDAEIGSDDEVEDELEAAELVEREKLQEKLELKKKKPVYDPNEVNEGEERTVLGHYDDEISGKKRKRFTLDERGQSVKQTKKEEVESGKGIKINLDDLMDEAPVNDYAEYKEAKVRKAKKQKKRTAKQRKVDEDEPAAVPLNVDTLMDLDGVTTSHGAGAARKQVIEIDDEDLQTQLATKRRQALKQRKKLDAAELARQIREASAEVDANLHEDEDEPGLVIDETREFVSHLKHEDSEDSEAEARRRRRASSTPAIDPVPMDDDMDEAMADATADGATVIQPTSRSPSPGPVKPTTSTGLEAEETTSSLGSVAAMLRKRGLLSDSDATRKASHQKQYAEFLAANRQMIVEFDARARAERERDRDRGAFAGMTNAQKNEYARRENDKREAYLARLQAEHFARNYKPDVKLEYHDEFGRELGQKEAFKHLSHQFHGKGSGKGKMEKRLKKIEDEKRREGRGLLEDGSGGRGMGGVAAEQGKRRGVAGVRLQ